MIDNNEPAFPFVETHEILGARVSCGMTLRDYFAAKAMAAILLIKEIYEDCNEEQVAKGAYAQADAMLEARKEKKGR